MDGVEPDQTDSGVVWLGSSLFALCPYLLEAIFSMIEILNPLFLVSSADNLCKQFRSRSDPTFCRAWSGPKLFDTLIIFLEECFEKVDFERKKNHQTTKEKK